MKRRSNEGRERERRAREKRRKAILPVFRGERKKKLRAVVVALYRVVLPRFEIHCARTKSTKSLLRPGPIRHAAPNAGRGVFSLDFFTFSILFFFFSCHGVTFRAGRVICFGPRHRQFSASRREKQRYARAAKLDGVGKLRARSSEVPEERQKKKINK